MAYTSKRKSSKDDAPVSYLDKYSRYYKDDTDDDNKGWRGRRSGIFDRVGFYKKPDLITPTLHWLDEYDVKKFVRQGLDDQSGIQKRWGELNTSSKFAGKLPMFNHYYRKLRDNFEKIPAHMMYDIFKLYYQHGDKLKFTERTDKNKMRYKLLERSNDAVGKIMTENSNLKSAVFTRAVVLHYLMYMTAMDYTDQRASQKMSRGLNEEKMNPSTRNSIEQMMDNMMNNQQFDKDLQSSKQEAQQICQMLDDNIDSDTQEKMFTTSGGEGSTKVNVDTLNNVKQSLEQIQMNMNGLKPILSKLLDKSTAYFSARKQIIYDDLFNASDISGLDEYALLHPKVRKLFAEDVLIPTVKMTGKINVYVDISGSMHGTPGITNNGKSLNKLDFAKSFIAQLMKNSMVNNIYTFNTEVQHVKTNLVNVAFIDTSGGTDLNEVVKHAIEQKSHALVITDAEDDCRIYSEEVFFIGVKGAKFTEFEKTTMRQYAENNQAIVFDGQKIYQVNQYGALR